MKRLVEQLKSWLHAAFDTAVCSLTEIGGLYFPHAGESGSVVLCSILNLSVVSSLGTEAVNAMGMVNPIHLIMQNVYISGSLTATVFVSQYLGAKQPERAAKCIVQLTRLLLSFSVLVSLLLVLLRAPLLALLYPNASALERSYAAVYFFGVIGTGPCYVLACVVNGMLRAKNQAGHAFFVSFMLNTLALSINFFMVRVLGLGIVSLAVSCITARIVTFFYLFRFLFGKRRVMDFSWRENWKRDPVLIRQMLRAAVPYATENLFFQAGKLAVQIFAVALGSAAATVNTIGLTLMNYVQFPGTAMADTAATVVGRAMGADDVPVAKKYTRSFFGATVAVNLVFFLFVLATFRPTMLLFHTGAEITRAVFVIFLIVGGANVLFWPGAFSVESCLKAAGDMRFTTQISVLTEWLVCVLLGYVLSFPAGLGISGIWLAIAAGWALRCIIFLHRAKGPYAFSHRLI